MHCTTFTHIIIYTIAFMEIVKPNWKFQASKILSRGCEVLHYDSGVDNDEKEGDRRTKQDL